MRHRKHKLPNVFAMSEAEYKVWYSTTLAKLKSTPNREFYWKHCACDAEYVAKRDLPLCRARCRDGHACRARVVRGRRRCRLHGGLSTGPTTRKGKTMIAASNRRRAMASRAAKRLAARDALGVMKGTAASPGQPRRVAPSHQGVGQSQAGGQSQMAGQSHRSKLPASQRPTRQRLPETAKRLIVGLNALGYSPSVVASLVQTQYGFTISRQHVEKYNPQRAAGRNLSQPWRHLFATALAQYAAHQADHAAISTASSPSALHKN
ncbi:MAG: DUF2280 domain-containing protein [Abitibacteriaceae bacterium]|nr:DUF2280 domain-containing protein [Abditibacteriaceae bacterium]